MDDLQKRRFEQIAGAIVTQQALFVQALKQLNGAALTLEALLSIYLDNLEKASGPSAEIDLIRAEVGHAWNQLVADSSLPAIEASMHTFDDAAVHLAQLVGAMP